MTTITIDNKVSRDFGIVPNDVWRTKLSTKAKALLAYLYGIKDGWTVYTADMDDAISVGRDAGQKARKELIDAGLMEYKTPTDRYGRARGKTLVLHLEKLADLVALKNGNNDRLPENQSVGEPGNAWQADQGDIRNTKPAAREAAPSSKAPRAAEVIEKKKRLSDEEVEALAEEKWRKDPQVIEHQKSKRPGSGTFLAQRLDEHRKAIRLMDRIGTL